MRLGALVRTLQAEFRLLHVDGCKIRSRGPGCRYGCWRIRMRAWHERSWRERSQGQRNDGEQRYPQNRKASCRVQPREQFQKKPHRHRQECTLADSVEKSCHCKIGVCHLCPPCSLSVIIFLIRRNSAWPIVSSFSRFTTSSSQEPPKNRFTRELSAFRLASS